MRGGGGRLGPLGACSLLLVVLVVVVVESGRAAPARHHQSTPQHHAADEGGLATEEEGPGGARAKRHLIGTPSLPLMMDPRRKRPFCNAFTGCGRKRSDEGLAPEQGLDETMGTLVELNSEPAVAELSRQILSEAKLWEAIQEARQEMMARQRQRQQHLIGTPSLPLMMDPRRKRPFCNAFTGCGRKRSDEGLAPEQGLDETMGTLVELNSEPAVAELSRQILSEAKLWEAIQEARQEMMARQRQRQQAAMVSQRRRRRRESGPAEAAEGGQMGRRAPPESDLLPPAIPKGTLPSAGNGALPIV